MFYDEQVTMKVVEEEPSQIFDLINENHVELVNKILSKKIVNINLINENEDSILIKSELAIKILLFTINLFIISPKFGVCI